MRYPGRYPGDGVFHHEARKEEETLLFFGGGVKGGPGKRGRGAKLSVRHYPSPSDLGVTWESLSHAWSPSSFICKMGWRSHSVQHDFGIWGGDCQPDRL